MPSFRKKPVVIEAQQWFPGADIDDVRQIDPTLKFSLRGDFYYLSAMGHPNEWGMANAWLPTSGEGDIKPFVFWEIKHGEEKPAVASDPLVVRYLEHMKWPSLPPAYGIVDTLEGKMTAMPGDWIITGVKGDKYPCNPDIFEATYEAV
jgi:hypothetical protein